MTLSGLLAALGAERSFANLRTRAGLPPGERSAETVISAPDGMRAVLTAQLRGALDDAPAPADDRAPVLLAVTATGRESEDLAAALGAYLPGEGVAEFPAWETLPHERLSPRSDTVGRRLDVLRRLAGRDAERPLRVLTAPVRSVLQPVVEGLGDMDPVANWVLR